MLVDIHAHIGLSSPSAGSLPELSAFADECAFDAVLVSNRDAAALPAGAPNLNEADANRACLDACAQHPHLRPLYWARPGQPDSNVHAVRGALETEPFVGLLLAPSQAGFDAASPLLGPYLDVLAVVGRPAVVCVGGDQHAAPAKIYDHARRHPKLSIVLCVCGGTSQRAPTLDVVRHALRSEDADLYMDTSHATAQEIDAAVEALGPDRVLFGTDAPCHGAAHGRHVAALLQELRTILAPDEFEQVCGENAARLFSLRGPRP